MLSDRFNPRIPANEYATHSIPGARALRSDPSKAKLNTTTTRRPNRSMEVKASLFLYSMAMSFATMAATGLIETPRHGCTSHRLPAPRHSVPDHRGPPYRDPGSRRASPPASPDGYRVS